MSDVAELQREIESLRRENQSLQDHCAVLSSRFTADKQVLEERADELLTEIGRKETKIRSLESQLAYYIQRCHGPKSEKVHPAQLSIAFAEADELAPDLPIPPFAGEAPDDEDGFDEKEAKKKGKKPRRRGRLKPPPDAPRERIVHEPDASDRVCACCQHEKVQIGEDVTEEIDFVPASLFVREHVRPKYACPRCPDEGVAQAELPSRPIERGKPGVGLLAHLVTSKFSDHLPLHRLENIFLRQGWEVPRSTMCDWLRDTSFLLSPIVDEMKRGVLASHVVQCDDTSVRMQKNWKRGGARNCHLWAYVGDRDEVVYDFTLTRAGSGPREFLAEYEGYLQADAYSAFDELYKSGKIVEVGCWAHARRKFRAAMKQDPRNASWAIALIQGLYRVESEAKESGLTLEELHRLRQEKSAPALEAFREWMNGIAARPVKKDELGLAVQYVDNQWDALNRYLENPRLSIDNNACERAMRCVAVGRKNWLFTGSEDGGKRAAILYSVVESCRLQGINVFEYLGDVLRRVDTHPVSCIAELTPSGWKEARAAAAAPCDPATSEPAATPS